MLGSRWSVWLLSSGLLLLVASCPLIGRCDDPPARATNPDHKVADDSANAIKPSPAMAIPDDSPPHEGAMIDIPLLIEPPDIIIVEVLEALPGRPIQGERLVRPDGTISLGFYGDIHVRGLTPNQAKVKIIHHLRKFLIDDVLGLTSFRTNLAEVLPLPAPGTKIPSTMTVPVDNRPFEKPDVERGAKPAAPDVAKPVNPTAPEADAPGVPKSARTSNRTRPERRPKSSASVRRGLRMRPAFHQSPRSPVEPSEPPQLAAPQPQVVAGEIIYVDPVESERVFVDLASYNSKVYFVQGDVGSPGRLPITGKETVLDAINYAGGLIPTAEPSDIHLYRPARGGKAAKDYRIDLAAILRGEAKANLQIFSDDRIVVGRNEVVKKTIEIDRAAAPLNSVFNSALQQSFILRSLGAAAGDINGTSAASRDQMLKRWFDYLWNPPLDQQPLRDSFKAFLDAAQEPKSPATPK